MRAVLLSLLVSCFVLGTADSVLAGGKNILKGIGEVGEVKEVFPFFRFQFTEGPAADTKGNVYFNDIPNNLTYKIDAKGILSVFRNPSGHANGLMVNQNGEIVSCEMDGRITATQPGRKTRTRVLASEYKGKRFNAPNDLVIDKQGGFYFTDPLFRAPMPLPQDTMGVYYVSAKGKVTRVIESLPAPNGVILSPDEKTLYIVPSRSKKMMSYPVEAPGKLGEGRVFCELRQAQKGGNSGGDGLTVDVKGNLYITSGLGLQVFSPKGEYLGVIEIPQRPANVTFAGKNGTTLYVTARTAVYTVEMPIGGHQFARGK
ncbi:MAG: SMP-30/gluconolactonase/LRE family protein [Gemmataceae bacterium]